MEISRLQRLVRSHHEPVCFCPRCYPSMMTRIRNLPSDFPRMVGVPQGLTFPALSNPTEEPKFPVGAASEEEIAISDLRTAIRRTPTAESALLHYIELLGASTNAVLQDLSDRASRTAAVFAPISGDTQSALRYYSAAHSVIASFSSLLDDCTTKVVQFQRHAQALQRGDHAYEYTEGSVSVPWSTPPPTPVAQRPPNAFADIVTYTTAPSGPCPPPASAVFETRSPIMHPRVQPSTHYPVNISFTEEEDQLLIRCSEMPFVTAAVPKTNHYRALMGKRCKSHIAKALLRRFRQLTGHQPDALAMDAVTSIHG